MLEPTVSILSSGTGDAEVPLEVVFETADLQSEAIFAVETRIICVQM